MGESWLLHMFHAEVPWFILRGSRGGHQPRSAFSLCAFSGILCHGNEKWQTHGTTEITVVSQYSPTSLAASEDAHYRPSFSCWVLIFMICDTVLVGLIRHPSVLLNLLHWFFSADFLLCPFVSSFCLVLFSCFSKFLRWDLKLVTWDFTFLSSVRIWSCKGLLQPCAMSHKCHYVVLPSFD